jgi:PAS domain-containing protein
MLQSDQAIEVRRIGTNETAVARIVAPMGVQSEGRLYGVETRESCEGLWGIRFSSAFYEKLLDNLQDGLSSNRERKVTYWNEGAKRLAGFTSADFAGAGFTGNEVLGKEVSESLLLAWTKPARHTLTMLVRCTAPCSTQSLGSPNSIFDRSGDTGTRFRCAPCPYGTAQAILWAARLKSSAIPR